MSHCHSSGATTVTLLSLYSAPMAVDLVLPSCCLVARRGQAFRSRRGSARAQPPPHLRVEAHQVLDVDLSAPMITAARTANHRPEVRFEVGDVLELDQPASYEVVFSSLRGHVLRRPNRGLAYVKTLGRPDARLGFCSWGATADNPWMTMPLMATLPTLGAPALAKPGDQHHGESRGGALGADQAGEAAERSKQIRS